VIRDNVASGNTAVGTAVLRENTTGIENTAVGLGALQWNETGDSNTALGYAALLNSTADQNTAVGSHALTSNLGGALNAALGLSAMHSNETGSANVALGHFALRNSVSEDANVAVGFSALRDGAGSGNTAVGYHALAFNGAGDFNTAVGFGALRPSTGTQNIAVGYLAGSFLSSGNDNVYIGNRGASTENATIRIGSNQTQAFICGVRGVTTGAANAINVMIDSNGQLGTVSSSRPFKEDIRDMGDATAALIQLRPVSFRYRDAFDGAVKPIEYGLIAEEVADVYPDLVVHSPDGQIETVQYHKVNAMLLNEVQQQHQRLGEQDEQIAWQAAQIEAQQRQIERLLERLVALEEK